MACPRCLERPNFHSFHSIGKTGTLQIWYSKPALNEERRMTEQYVQNYLLHMDQAHNGGDWLYIFDAQGLDKMEPPNLFLMQRFYKAVQERYDTSLQKVLILNKNWAFQLVFTMIRPFMSERAKAIYHFISSPLELSQHVPIEIVRQIYS
jgi:hypothetical protein